MEKEEPGVILSLEGLKSLVFFTKGLKGIIRTIKFCLKKKKNGLDMELERKGKLISKR